MLLLRFVVAAALAVSGWIHLDLADTFDFVGEQITLGTLFRLQGAAALVVALWLLLVRRSWLPELAALLIGLVSLLAVVLSVYVRFPALGPFPEVYEPIWYVEKSASAVTAGLAAVGSGLLLAARRRRALT